jgi:hypothetical protein
MYWDFADEQIFFGNPLNRRLGKSEWGGSPLSLKIRLCVSVGCIKLWLQPGKLRLNWHKSYIGYNLLFLRFFHCVSPAIKPVINSVFDEYAQKLSEWACQENNILRPIVNTIIVYIVLIYTRDQPEVTISQIVHVQGQANFNKPNIGWSLLFIKEISIFNCWLPVFIFQLLQL